jgi:uncharacterized protein
MKYVFADTVGILAVFDTTDQWHEPAESVFQSLLLATTRLITTTYVLLECGNAAARRPYRSAVLRLRDQWEAEKLLITPTQDDWELAWEAYRRGEAGQAGIVDHVSFQVMRRLKIQEAFTNDRHFAAAGFQVLF